MNDTAQPDFAALRQRLHAYLQDELLPFEQRHGIGYEDRLPRDTVRGLW
jgi:hypothetical protein